MTFRALPFRAAAIGFSFLLIAASSLPSAIAAESSTASPPASESPALPAVNAGGGIAYDQLCIPRALAPASVAAKCAVGQKVAFYTLNDAQLAAQFAAWNCDLRYQVAITAGGVTCIFLPSAPSEKGAE